MSIKSLIRTIPDYPKLGVQFRDITTLLADAEGFRQVIDDFCQRYKNQQIDKIVAIEARGFILGAALAYKLGAGLVPVRKAGKLPAETMGHDYVLEYGSDRVEIHADAIRAGDEILLVDDLIATGGTAEAAATLIQKLGGNVVECAFVIDLPNLGGINRLKKLGLTCYALCAFEGE
ncbi:MAG TPA: adenine phosphoribosyltransferase [Methylophilaceae bacterium]|nr:adenine phosphoribosyltransferase [Methylophilaceae bacterium]